MSKVQLSFQADEEIYKFDASLEVIQVPPSTEDEDGIDDMGVSDMSSQLDQAREIIRGYTEYAISAFRNFSAAEVQELTLKFGIKLGGKAGIPYITEGSAESNLEIEVKCKFPEK
jgi:Trypsin-co-occurring domain 1